MNAARRFFLETTPFEGAPRLLPADREHALKVLRLGAGDRLLGLDGRGKSWELEVERADRTHLDLRVCGPPTETPPPGTPGACLPWIEVWCPLPKGNRAEAMLGRLTQLGLARLVPLTSKHTEVQAREASEPRRLRLERTTREALKQSGRLWLPEIAGSQGFEGLLLETNGPRFLLDQGGESGLSKALLGMDPENWTRESPLVIIAGPEAGFAEQERAALSTAGVRSVRIGPHVLRIETAVEAALAIVAERCLHRI